MTRLIPTRSSLVVRTCLLLLIGLLPLWTQAQEAVLPTDVRQALNERLSSWSFVDDPSQGHVDDAWCPAPPAVLRGDFDGDGASDYLFQITVPNPWGESDEVAQTAIVLARRGHHEVHVLRHGSDVEGTLDVVSRGTEIRLPLDEVDLVLEDDAVSTGYCEKASTLYVYYGGGFVPLVTGD